METNEFSITSMKHTQWSEPADRFRGGHWKRYSQWSEQSKIFLCLTKTQTKIFIEESKQYTGHKISASSNMGTHECRVKAMKQQLFIQTFNPLPFYQHLSQKDHPSDLVQYNLLPLPLQPPH